MIDPAYWPVIVAGVLAAHFWFRRRLSTAAQPLRLELASRGEALLARGDLSPSVRASTEVMLEEGFGARLSLLMGLALVPILAVVMVLRMRVLSRFMREAERMPSSAYEEFQSLMRLHDRINLANNPFLMVAVEVTILVFLPVAILARGLIVGKLPKVGDRAFIMTLIEHPRVATLLRH